MMTVIENTPKADRRKAREAAEHAYNHRARTYSDIFAAYGRPSAEKVKAWDRCRRLCAELDGFDMLISGRNTSTFSVVFKFPDAETGELCYAYITRDYDRFCHAAP